MPWNQLRRVVEIGVGEIDLHDRFRRDHTRSNAGPRLRLLPIHASWVTLMRPYLQVAVAIASAFVPAAAIAQSTQIPSPLVAPGAAENVRVQPRERGFVPNSGADDEVQRQLTIFNAQQAVQDAAFDRKLKICRRC